MEKYPTMDEMIEECKKNQRPDEEIVFTFGAGRIIPKIGMRKQMKAGMDLVKAQDGFLGVHPIDLWHTLLIFDTLNNAKGARNNLKAKGMGVGQVAPILVEKQFICKDDDMGDCSDEIPNQFDNMTGSMNL